ncbi:MAG: LCP family protein, partial [Clostridium sp.]|uniref:LCP family protein n=1 Tax=Clostridium sp. TaxID=1506 RepID=UPI003F3C75D4
IRNKIYSNDNIVKNKNIDYKEVPGITNILLLGSDARNLDEPSRSDSMMILTIDNNKKKLKLTSIMRDTFVEIPGHGKNKINAAMSKGGIPLVIETINTNFNMNLDKYVMVNFNGFEEIIDLIGGIDVEIKDYEIEQLNKYIGEQHKEKSPKIKYPGMHKLDGQQALSYARIRKTGNGDYERTDRQRRILGIVAEKFKDVSVFKYPGIMNQMLPYVKTNIEPFDLLNYAYTVSKFPSFDIEQLRLPIDDLTADVLSYKGYGAVLLIDTKQHGNVLYDFIYNDKMPTKESYNIEEWKGILNTEYYGYGAINTNKNYYGVEKPRPPLIEKPEVEEEEVEPVVKPEKPIVKPEKPVVKPEEPTVKPEEPTVKPEEPTVKPEEPTVKPEKPVVKPEEKPNDKPENSEVIKP